MAAKHYFFFFFRNLGHVLDLTNEKIVGASPSPQKNSLLAHCCMVQFTLASDSWSKGLILISPWFYRDWCHSIDVSGVTAD